MKFVHNAKGAKIAYLFLILNLLPCKGNALPEPYNSIILLPEDLHGWFCKENENKLKQIILEKKPKVIVEIGSWCGKSAIFMASLLTSDSKLYTIDHWFGQSYYFENPPQEVANRLPYVYQLFLSNVIHHNLANIIIPIRMSSLEAAQALNISPDLVYIDGSHTEEDVYNDILAWHKKLSANGIICGDDWACPAVKTGIEKAIQQINLKVASELNFWWLY